MAIVTLTANSCGYLTARRLPEIIQVHSCFSHALNLIDDDGHLFTLLSSEKYQNLPDAVRVTQPENWDWRQQASRGETVRTTAGKLQARHWQVDISAATIWQPRLGGSSVSLNALPDALRHYETLSSQLFLFCLEHQVESDLLWARSPLSPSESKRQLAPAEAMEQFESQVAQLIGFGRGLTPDGDDYLLGYLAALWPWKLNVGLREHQQRLHQAISINLPRTTDISRHYLNRALEGHYSQPVCELLEKITTRTPTADVIAATEHVMQFGASSGVDCLAGILHGLRNINTAH
ncbi:DUF2877 domain-containing protein [Buttiauxella sp. A111]|uniref:DUF2877 domain-containing protein n=1 Tax=Buttiauxella sp. A111 TaxID=2563088 RepID=UPI0010E62874|nr:DUF2877 domain-containing protein [Buttiauxella sp. A111]GDX08021.1 DUF2877 domain-containing protein [Buttiauxella sp. A111]